MKKTKKGHGKFVGGGNRRHSKPNEAQRGSNENPRASKKHRKIMAG
jgi:hypothetical protein